MSQPQIGMFLNEQRFEFAQRIGKMLSASTMLPEHFRNNLGNCLIALNLAERLGLDVFGLMQTSYVVHGRPGFEAKLLIAIFNSRTQLFIPPLRWEFRGDFPKGKDAGCRAYAVDKETHEPLYGEWIDWDLVTAEGWEKKAGSKWLTMPGQMYRYRAASFFINAYEPGLKMGIHTVDELQDMVIDITPPPPGLPKGETNGDPKPGAAVYEFKTEGKEPESVQEQKGENRQVIANPPGTVIEGEDPKAETPKVNGGAEQKPPDIAGLLAEIKKTRPKAGKEAMDYFKELYLENRDLIISLTGPDFDYCKGKWQNAGLSWENDFLGPAGVRLPDPAQAATSPQGKANGSGQEEKTQAPQPSNAGQGQNKAEPKEEWLIKAEQCRDRILELGPEGEAVWHSILKLYSMIGKELKTLQPGYRDAFIKRAQGQLDLEIQKKDARAK
jgi:hypothetical protein